MLHFQGMSCDELNLAALWATLQAAIIVAARHDACVRLAPLARTAAAAYTFGAFSEAQFFAHGEGESAMQRGTRLAAGLGAWALALAFSAAELRT